MGRIKELDGLRGIAILLVLFHHMSLYRAVHMGTLLRTAATYSWVGVDIFFVLSGFLITSILLKAQPGVPALKTFYIKRALRIWPLYFLMLALVCLDARMLHKAYPWLASLFLVQNFSPHWGNLGFNQSWSLCVEEHFYLVWPLLVFLAPRRALPWILGAILLLSPLLRFWALGAGVPLKLLYTSTQYRLDAIGLGSLIAFVHATGLLDRTQLAKIGHYVLPFAFAALVVELVTNPGELGQRSATLYTWAAFASGGLVCVALNPAATLFAKILSFKVLTYVGTISYGLYMIHGVVLGVVFSAVHGDLHPWLQMMVGFALSFAAAALSFRYFESRMLALRSGHSAVVSLPDNPCPPSQRVP